MKNVVVALLVLGIGTIGVSGYQHLSVNHIQNDSLDKAKEITISDPDITLSDASNVAPSRANTDGIEKNDNKKEVESIEFHPEIGEVIGVLKIPKLEAELPIIEGVGADELDKGVGHHDKTAFPGQPSQIVLSGHRDTVFRGMDEIEIGDEFIVEMPYGTVTYVMESYKIVDKDDLTIIRPHDYDEEILTITTCYPFNFIGPAPERYIIFANPVKKEIKNTV